MKTCSKSKKALCSQVNPQPKTNFSPDKRNKDELYSYCKSCAAAQSAKYQKENPEKIAIKNAEYYKENTEKIAVKHAEYYKENSKKLAVRRAEYYKENSEKIIAQKVEYKKQRRKNDPVFKLL